MAWECEKCGFCCCGKGNRIYLTEEEINSGLYETANTKRKNGEKALILLRKTFYHKRAMKVIIACFYLNTETFLCEIYSQRPVTCKNHTCKGKQKSNFWSKK